MPNAKILSEKQAIVESLAARLQGASAGVFVDYRGITRMYGAAHCSSQVFRCPDPAHYAEYAALFDDAQKRVDAARAAALKSHEMLF